MPSPWKYGHPDRRMPQSDPLPRKMIRLVVGLPEQRRSRGLAVKRDRKSRTALVCELHKRGSDAPLLLPGDALIDQQLVGMKESRTRGNEQNMSRRCHASDIEELRRR